MDRRTRYSIGTSINISNPIAESTHYVEDKNSSTQRPKRKQTSPLHSSAKSIFRANSSSGLLSRIDPIVYTDAQSTGLASRIVKYHESNHRPHSQQSASPKSLYDRPGQLPLVHLKKVEIKYVPKRSLSTSSVRIAAPKKSMFQASSSKLGPLVSMASVILSSTSTLKKPGVTADDGDKQLTDNEPLVPSGETTTSKSALDALKEISRKRINSEELDVDRYKKQCKEISEIDGMVEIAGGGGKNSTAKPTTSKRGRETSVSAQNTSAEHLQKKLCTKNNDILSSLSSSLSEPSLKCVVEAPNSQSEKVLIIEPTAPAKSVSAVWQQPSNLNQETAKAVQKTYSEPMMPTLSASPAAKAPKLTLFNKKYDPKPVVRPVLDSDDDDEEERNNFVVPLPKNRSPIMVTGKETLRQVEKSKLSLMLSCLNDDDEDEVDKAPAGKLVTETKTISEIVAPSKEIAIEAPKVDTPKATLDIVKEPAKELQPLPTAFKLPEPAKLDDSAKAAPALKDSATIQLSTANLISFSPSPLEKPKEVSFAPMPTTAAVSFSVSQTLTLPAPKASVSLAASSLPKTTSSFDTLVKPVMSSESPKTFSFEPPVSKTHDANNSVTATIKLPSKTFSFGEPTGAAPVTAVPPTSMFSSGMTQSKPNFEMGQAKTTPPPAYSLPSSAMVADAAKVSANSALSGIVFGSATKLPSTPVAVSSGFNFGQPSATTSPFGLGTMQSNETPVSKEERPAFGFASKSAATPAFSSFGGITTAQVSKIDSVSPAPIQMFGAAVPRTTETLTKTPSFTFGGEKPSLGSGFAFNSFSPQATPPTTFGKTPTNAISSSTIAAPQQTTISSSSMFGSQPVQSSNIFGQKLGDSADKPASNGIFGANTNSSNVFGAGGLTQSNNSNLFTAKTEESGVFGSVGNKPPVYTPPGPQTPSTFGASPMASTFSFGGSNSSQPAQQKNEAGFPFGGQSTVPAPNNSFSFTSGTGSKPPNVFGGGSAISSTGVGTGFNFSSATNNNNNNGSNNSNTANPSPFAFKGPNDSTTPTNLFPSFSSGSATAEKPAAFNFGGSNVAQPSSNMFGEMSSTSNPMAPVNPFSMVGGGQQQQQQQRRPMRQGMRRLNK